MPSKYPFFDTSRLVLRSVHSRRSKVQLSDIVEPVKRPPCSDSPDLRGLATEIVQARAAGKPVIFFMGAHAIKCGMGGYLRRFLDEELVTLMASNGAATIHDFELSMFGYTSEIVSEAIKDGEFGLWEEHEQLNATAGIASRLERGFGEYLGFWLARNAAYANTSVLAMASEKNIPFTVHVLIGGDITHMHAGRGDKIGQASYNDFLIFTEHLRQLQEQGGVFVSVGSAVQGPEIYLKSLSMARNVLRQDGKPLARFATAVLDMYPLPTNWRDGEAGEDEPGYYFRPWKTILLRSLAEGGSSFYVQGNYKTTLPALYQWIHRIR
jgi:hypothetical protein